MVQFRRLDPLANAGPYQRLLKYPVKSVTLTEAQFNRVQERRPNLVVNATEAMIVGVKAANDKHVPFFFHNFITPISNGDVTAYIGYDQWGGAANLAAYTCGTVD